MQDFPDKEVIVVEDGDDGGFTRTVCSMYAVEYLQRKHRPGVRYSNPAVPNNIGLRAATGEVVILQNAECEHITPDSIQKLYDRALHGHAVFAAVEAVSRSGTHLMWYTHSVHNPRPFFFCGALRRYCFERLGGFDEDYTLYGWDDNDFADRLSYVGTRFDFADDIHVKHHEHESSFKADEPNNFPLYEEKTRQFKAGTIGPVRNLKKE
jgi:GT2 family glycosyltransferase